jgi:hypothetical protein
MLRLIHIDEPHVGFVDERGRLERLAGLFVGHSQGRELAQLIIHERQELFGSRRIALLDCRQDACNVPHGRQDTVGSGELQKRVKR